MKKALFILALMLTGSYTCFAALSPLNESIVEIRTLVNSTELSQYLNQNEVILGIQKIDRGYVVITNQSALEVDINYEQSGKPGPQEFKLRFHPPVPFNPNQAGQGAGGAANQPGAGQSMHSGSSYGTDAKDSFSNQGQSTTIPRGTNSSGMNSSK